jgi:S-adenosylmethionine/arginine decarboxylase-like enzyme
MQGLHLTADLSRCQCDMALLLQAPLLSARVREQTLASGLTIVGELWHTFPEREQPGGGVTGVLLLAESHVAVHTWPELSCVTLDVYVCNLGADNSAKAQTLLKGLETLFQATQIQRGRLDRAGGLGENPNP